MQKSSLILLSLLSIASVFSGYQYINKGSEQPLYINQETFLSHNNNDSQNSNYQCDSTTHPCLQYEFSFINYTWQNPDDYKFYMDHQLFNQTLMNGIKVAKNGRMFVSLPRWKQNAKNMTNPATLVEIKRGQSQRNPLLTPYPSWEMNKQVKGGSGFHSDALQSVLGLEIVDNTLWALDQGNIDGYFVPGTIKLVKINLETNEIEHVHRFTQEEAGPDSFLNDLVIDQKHNFIYISDSNIFHDLGEKLQGALLSIDISQTPYKVKRQMSGSYYTNNNERMWLTINGEKVMYDEPMRTAADGIALTPDCEWVTFCALTNHAIYKIPSKFLRNFNLTDRQLEQQVQREFRRDFSSDGLTYGSNGDLFLTSLEGNGVYRFRDHQHRQYLAQNSSNMLWPDTFAWNNKGSIVFTSNQLHNFNNDQINFYDFDKPFYRIYSLFVGTNSYLEGPQN